jgi:hypothetical protein
MARRLQKLATITSIADLEDQMKQIRNLVLVLVGLLATCSLTAVNTAAQNSNMSGDQMKSSSMMNSNMNSNRVMRRHRMRRRHRRMRRKPGMMKSNSMKSPEMMKKN